jgi:hypothetical protein
MRKALLTSLICGIGISLVPNFEQVMYISPLIFGLTISSVHYKKLKINPIAEILIFIALSYLIYVLSIYLTFGLAEIYSAIENRFEIPIYDLTTGLILLISGILSAIGLYLLYSLFLKQQNRILGIILILITSTLIPLTVWLVSEDHHNTKNEDFAVYQMSWLIYISFGFGIAINQLELKNKLNRIINKN